MAADDKVNILIVDDLAEKVIVLESVLAELGENLHIARSGTEALQQVLRHDYAVILLDVYMPDIDGYETAALIRQRKKSAHTPIIFITAVADELHKTQAYSLGAVDFILAPVVPEILRTKVKVFVDLFRMTEQVKRHADERVALAREQAAREAAEAAQVAAEEANRRSSFLAEASTTLAGSLDVDVTVRNLARLVVPVLADLSAVSLAGEGGPGPSELAWVDRTAGGTSASQGDLPALLAEAVARVLAGGPPEVLEETGIEPVQADCPGSLSLPFALNRVVVLPLRARAKVLGALTLALGPSGRSYGPAERLLAEDLAGRAAVFLDNARLHRDIREADQRKNEFLSMLAHELRNPLAPIRNAVQIIGLQGSPPSTLQWAMEIIDRNVYQLVRLVDDLLDVSRITRGKIRLQPEPLDMAAVVAQAVEISQPLIESRRHELTVSVPEDPVWVNGDGTRLAQVLANLLNNAAKYTDEGGRIWLDLARENGDAVVRVRDTGVGIPPNMLASIFDLFTQVDRSLDRSQGGLGIGLTLARRLVEMHGGRVAVSSAGANQGSEFVVRLPVLARPPGPGSTTNGDYEPAADDMPRRVLIVDDNVDGAQSLGLMLQLAGHKVSIVHDGPTALKTAPEFRPDVVLLDIGLPEMNGYEVARRLRELPELADTLLVALTGYGQEEDRQRGREAGLHHHLVKPVDPSVLTRLLALGPDAVLLKQ
jgi:signal transduction histidine kinase/DNA-binding response OmpR family regulator